MPRIKKINLEKTAIAEYHHAIESGEIQACREIKITYAHLYKKLYDSKIDGYHYDYSLGQDPIDFISTFCHLPKLRGNPLCKLDLWQQAMVEAIFGFVDVDRNRQYSEVFFTVARKQGKSALAAMIALYLMLRDGEAEPELYCIATKKDQSKIIWEMAGQIISKSTELRKYLKKRVGDISCDFNNGLFKPLASDSNSLDGLNASVVLADELHSWKDSNLYDVMIDSMVARTQPLFLITTTAGFVRAGIYDQKIDEYEMIINGYDDPDGYKDPKRLPIIYKLDSEKEWTDYKAWVKANPGLGTIRPLDKLADDVERARHNPQKVPDLLTKFFDLPQNGVDHFLSIEELTNKETFRPEEQEIKYAIGGFDLSETTDLTSAVLMYQLSNDPTYYVLTMSWMPEDLYEKHIATDHVPYDIWRQKGWLRLCPGNQIDYHMVADWFAEMKNKYHMTIYRIGYDRYGAQYMTDEMSKKFGQLCMIPVAQNAMTLSIPLQNMRAEFRKHHINYQNNQLMKWCLGNLMVSRDNQGNYNTTKNRNDHIRDDAAMALLDAFCAYFQVYEKYSKLINR